MNVNMNAKGHLSQLISIRKRQGQNILGFLLLILNSGQIMYVKHEGKIDMMMSRALVVNAF